MDETVFDVNNRIEQYTSKSQNDLKANPRYDNLVESRTISLNKYRLITMYKVTRYKIEMKPGSRSFNEVVATEL